MGTYGHVIDELEDAPRLAADDPAFTLRLYTHGMRRDDDERDRLRALVEGTDLGIDTMAPTRLREAL